MNDITFALIENNSKWDLHMARQRIQFILNLMKAEKQHAHSHGIRNAYQMIIRLELEALAEDFSIPSNLVDDIPF